MSIAWYELLLALCMSYANTMIVGGRSPSFFLKKKWRFFHRKWWHFKWITDVGENIGERKGDILGELLEIATFLSPFLTPFSVKFFHQIKWRFLHRKWWVFWWVTKIGEYFGFFISIAKRCSYNRPTQRFPSQTHAQAIQPSAYSSKAFMPLQEV